MGARPTYFLPGNACHVFPGILSGVWDRSARRRGPRERKRLKKLPSSSHDDISGIGTRIEINREPFQRGRFRASNDRWSLTGS